MTSKSEVQAAFDRLCKALGRSQEVWIGNTANIGSLALDANPTYGGYVISEIVNVAGGTRQPFGYVRMPAEEFVRAVRFALDVVEMARRGAPR